MSKERLCPKCRAPLQEIEVSRHVKILSCPGCSGGFYPKDALAVKVELDKAAPSRYTCPDCGALLRTGTMYNGAIELDKCAGCDGVWFDASEVQRLRTLSGVEGILAARDEASGGQEAPAVPEPDKPKLSGGRAVVKGKDRGDWHDDNARFADPDVRGNPRALLDGVSYAHYQSALARVTGVAGEFTWRVAVGEKARVRDFVDPPFILSNEISGQDSVWSKGRYVPAAEVWSAFQMEGSPPPQTGVNPAQPDPYDESWGPILRWFSFALIIAIGMWGVLTAAKTGKVVYRGAFTYANTDAEKSRVTPDFVLDGHTSNVSFYTSTSLENHWAYLDFALINADTDEGLDFGREISFYHGVDDGEYWSEGGRDDEAVVPNVPPGRYYLRLEPEEGDAAAFNYSVTVKRDVTQFSPLVVALALLFLPVLLIGWRRWVFETARWRDSDHPWTKDEEDDD